MVCALSTGLAAFAVVLGPSISIADNVQIARAASVELRPTTDELARFAGHWDQVVDAAADESRIANIDAAIADLSWLVRKMAGGVLRDSTAPPPEVRFSWDGGQLAQHLAVDGEELVRRIELPESASAISFDDPDASAAESRWAWRDGRLEVLWTRDQARGFTRFRYDPSDDSLHVAYEIHVTALDGVEPIRYDSRFARRAPPRVGTAPRSVQVSGMAPAGISETE